MLKALLIILCTLLSFLNVHKNGLTRAFSNQAPLPHARTGKSKFDKFQSYNKIQKLDVKIFFRKTIVQKLIRILYFFCCR